MVWRTPRPPRFDRSVDAAADLPVRKTARSCRPRAAQGGLMLPFHTALVTGATGFIGRHLVRRLAALNVTTHCLVRASSLTAEVRRSLAPAQCPALDSAEPAAWEQALAGIAADVVFHLASPGVIGGKEPPEVLSATNVRLMVQLLTAVQSWPLRNI